MATVTTKKVVELGENSRLLLEEPLKLELVLRQSLLQATVSLVPQSAHC